MKNKLMNWIGHFCFSVMVAIAIYILSIIIILSIIELTECNTNNKVHDNEYYNAHPKIRKDTNKWKLHTHIYFWD